MPSTPIGGREKSPGHSSSRWARRSRRRRHGALGGDQNRGDAGAGGCGRGARARGRAGPGGAERKDRRRRRRAHPGEVAGRRGGARAARAREGHDAEGGRYPPEGPGSPEGRAGQEGAAHDDRGPEPEAGCLRAQAPGRGAPGRRLPERAGEEGTGPAAEGAAGHLGNHREARQRQEVLPDRGEAGRGRGLRGARVRHHRRDHQGLRPGFGEGQEAVAAMGDGARYTLRALAHVDPSASVGAYAVVEPKAVLGAGVRVGPFVYVGRGAEVGAETILHARVVVLDRVRIGRRVIVHAGAVLGADGFGYAPDAGRYRKIPQIGGVVIEDDVEIGANTTIDRSTVGDTVIGRGTKIDNLVQIAHNVHVGADSIIAAQSGVAGSSRLGRGVVLGGQVGVADHVTIADGVVVAAQAGVIGDLREAGTYLGTPARPVGETRRVWAVTVKLPELARRVRELERRLERFERGAGGATAEGGESPERG